MMKMNKLISHGVLAISLLMITNISCVEKIDLDVPAGLSDNVVIQGRVVLGTPNRVEVFSGRLFDFSAESRFELNLKEVIFMDDMGNEMILDDIAPGTYNTEIKDDDPIKIEVGRQYKLQVTTFDNRIYESSLDVLKPNVVPTSMSMGVVEELETNPVGNQIPVDRLEIYIDSKFDQNDQGVFWEIENTYKLTDTPVDLGVVMKTCYITQTATATSIPVLDLNNLLSGEVKDFVLIRHSIDFKMAEGMYFEVRQYSLSEEATNYFQSASILVEREGGLFEDPVGLIQSNFSNINDSEDLVYGFFYATQEEMIRMKVPVELVGAMAPGCPPPPRPSPGPGCNLGICCDCLIDPGSTVLRPEYWVD